MNTFDALEPIVREIKKLASRILLPQNPFDKIISTCNRLIALREAANFENIKHEIGLAWAEAETYISRLRALIGKINR